MTAPNFTDGVTGALQRAVQVAQDQGHTEVTENHLLLAFLEDSQGYFASALGDTRELQKEMEKALEKVFSQPYCVIIPIDFLTEKPHIGR